MHLFFLLCIAISGILPPGAVRCLSDANLRDSLLLVPAHHRLVEVWWDLHCPACHRQLADLARQKREGEPIVVVARRVGIESGDRATALRHVPPGVVACRATGPQSNDALPRVVVRDDQGRISTRWIGYRTLKPTLHEETTP